MSGRGYSDDRRDDRGGYGEKGGDRRGYDRQDRGRGDRDPGYGNDSNRGYRGDSNGRGDERNFSRGDRRGDDRDYGRDDRRDDRRDFGRDDGRNYGRDDRRDDRRDFGRDDGRGDRRDSNRGDRRDSNRGGGRGRGEPRGGGRGGPPRPVVRQESPQELPKVPQQQIAKRPDKGCGGKNRREVFANFVRVYVPEHMRVHKYDMQFFLLKNRQEVPMKKTEDISRVFWKMIGEGPALGDNRIVFDDKTTCWSLEDIPFPFTRTQDGTRIWKETAPPSRGPPRFQPALAMIRFVHREIYSYPEMAHLEEAIDSMRRLLDSMATQAARYPNRDEESARDAHYATIGRAIFARNPYQDNYARNLSVNLLRGLECWTGLSISIKMNGGLGIFCNVDVKNSIVVGPARRLTDEMIAISCAKSVEISPSTEAQKDAFLTENGMSSTFRKVMDQIFKGVRCVEMRNNRKFEYNGLTSQGADKTLFQLVRDGKPIILSVAEYYEKHLQAKLRYPHLPCVMSSKKSNGALYPLEWVGTLDTLIHPYNKPLKQDDRHLMLQGTSDLPNRRKKLIDQLAFNPPGENPQQPPIFRKNDPYCEKFGVEFGREFIRLPSLVLPALELDFESDPSIKQAEIATGMWDLKLPNGEFRKVPESQRRKIITAVIWFLDPRHDFASTEEMNVLDRHNQNEPHGPNNSRMATIFKTFEAFGHTWGGQKMFGNRVYHQKNLPDGRPRPNDVSLHQDLDEFIMDFKRGVKRNFPDYTPLILAIFAEKCSTIKGYANDYCTFKQACDVAYGVHCQGITQKVFKKITGNPLTCATSFLLSLKMMLKLGVVYCLGNGRVHKNWEKITDENDSTLILGIDVTHPGAEDRRSMDVQSASVASIVGNIDHTLMQWDVSYRVQPKGIERIVHMRDEIMARIRKFRMETGKLPKHIIVYRDGVSESEFQRALYNEKTDINVACKDIYGDNPHPTLTYIVVTKRHRTRFFPTTVDEDASELVSKSDRETRKQSCISTSSDNACRYNVAPGTLVETEITSPDYFDFYLVSQASPLGTAHPTHYYVLHDDWNPSPSFWQTVSYALCCSYMRCPKTISVPTPIMLAHLAAKRGKEYLEAINNRNRELVLTSKNRCEGWNHLLEHMTHPEDHIGMHFV